MSKLQDLEEQVDFLLDRRSGAVLGSVCMEVAGESLAIHLDVPNLLFVVNWTHKLEAP